MEPDQSRVRKRIPKSCRRCHRRKQRCVGFPTCANCESTKEPCTRAETAPSWHHGLSKSALVARIEILEAQLSDVTDGTPSAAQDPLECSPNSTHRDSRSNVSNPQLNGILQFSGPSHDFRSEPVYLGPSSGFSVAESLDRLVHAAVPTNALPINASSQQAESLWESSTDRSIAVPPDDSTDSQILEAYFKNMHMRLPFLDRSEILNLHAERFRPSSSNPA